MSVADLQAILAPLTGAVVDRARRSEMAGSWLDLEIGGTLIWIKMTAWILESDDDFLLACEDAVPHIGTVIRQLDGRRLTRVTVSPFLDLTLHFDRIRLATFTSASGGDDHHWIVEFPTDGIVLAGPGQRWSAFQTRPSGPWEPGS
jgi:hypothetical protein